MHLATGKPAPDEGEWLRRTNELAARREQLGADYAEGLIDRETMLAGTKAIRAQEALLQPPVARKPKLQVTEDRLRAAWPHITVSEQRPILETLIERVTVNFVLITTGAKKFDPRRFEIEWKVQAASDVLASARSTKYQFLRTADQHGRALPTGSVSRAWLSDERASRLVSAGQDFRLLRLELRLGQDSLRFQLTQGLEPFQRISGRRSRLGRRGLVLRLRVLRLRIFLRRLLGIPSRLLAALHATAHCRRCAGDNRRACYSS